MKQKMNKKNLGLVLVVIGVVLSAIVGAAFAYFSAQMGDGAESEINASSGRTESLMFEKSGDISITADQTDFYDGAPDKSQTETVKAILTPNDATKYAKRTYNVFFIVDDNDFIYTTKELKKPEITMQVKGPDGYVQNIPGLTPIEDENAFDITTKRHMAFKIAENYEIEANETPTTQTWEITVTLVNLDTIQNENGGKTLKGRVYITTEEMETYKLINVKSISPEKDWQSITAVMNIDNGTVDVDKYYFAIEKTNEEPAKISFKTIAEALSYKYHESLTNSYTFKELDNGEKIQPGQNYKIYSYAVDKEGYRSNIYSEIIKTDDYKPVEIGKVSYETTWNSIKITGVETKGGDGAAELYRFKKDIEGTWSDYSENPTIEYKDLDPSTEYRIYVQVKDSNGIEAPHSEEAIRTNDYNYVTVNPSITDITNTSMKVNVNTINGDGDVTEVIVQKVGDDQYVLNGNGSYSKTYYNLVAGQNYSFNIKVTDSNGMVVNKTVSDRAHWRVDVVVENGYASPTWGHAAHNGSTTFTVEPEEFFYDAQNATASPENNCEMDNGTLIAKNITDNTTCNVSVPLIKYHVTVNVVNGHAEPESADVTFGEGTTFKLSANPGYDLGEAVVTSGSCELTDGNTKLTINPVLSEISCTVEIPLGSGYHFTCSDSTLACWVAKKRGIQGDGELIYHNGKIVVDDYYYPTPGEYDAADDSYRYAGNEPNNYVCLGNKGSNGGCDSNSHLYRIIGVIPTSVEGQTQNLVKLIKSEYLTHDELGKSADATGITATGSYNRIKNLNNIEGFYWSGSSDGSNEWANSTLYAALNNNSTGFLNKMGSTWASKIQPINWSVVGVSTMEYQQTPRMIYDVERNQSTAGFDKPTYYTVNASVGLLYESEYGFAYNKDYWSYYVGNYEDQFQDDNWLFNGVDELFLDRNSDGTSDVIYRTSNNGIRGFGAGAYSIRPTFFLKQNVTYVSGTGSYSDPIFIN